jgi:hydroxyacylglutathione hydrolase
MTQKIPLEDSHLDILSKTQAGLGLSDSALLAAAGVSVEELAAVREGRELEEVWRRLAAALQLGPEALCAAARKAWYPQQPPALNGFLAFNTAFEDMRVNSYLVWDSATREAAAFDTGADVGAMLKVIDSDGLQLRQIFLTHTHPDHVADLTRLAQTTGANVWAHEREPSGHPQARTFADGANFAIGRLEIEARLTWGHSPGLTSYVVKGLDQPLAVIGDALFAGSIGGSRSHYLEQRQHDLERILTLPGPTILASGHGPLTTVAQEWAHNPFFTPFQSK